MTKSTNRKNVSVVKRISCAVYTRKSTEDGLEQEFNSLDAQRESGGLIRAVTDREILSAYRLLARSVGVFVELGSAASVAGLLQTAAAGDLPAGSTVVCTVTGHGLKDPEWAIATAPSPVTINAEPLAAAKALDLA